ncbi:MAG: amino acid ABC transporter substrate-binding protein [Flexilinea sp.]|nr:amino acid ABC transporter substrate-binding protein [Flexilinea sp.]
MKKSILLCIFIMLLCCNSAAVFAEPIRVAINPDSKPFKYYDENGSFAGIDADVMKALAEELDLEIEYVEMKFEDIFESVESCEVDAAISALSKTENRSEQVFFTDAYLMGQLSAFVRMKNDNYKDISDENINIIGSKTGTTAETAGREIAGMFNLEQKHYENYAELFAALENDQIDAALSDEILAKEFVNSYADIMTIGQVIAIEPYAIAVCPNNDELLQKFNNGLASLQQSGKLEEILLTNLMGNN